MKFAPILTAMLLAMPVSVAQAETLTPTLTIQGSAEVTGVPDMASFSLSVNTEGESARAALTANNEDMSAVIAKLKASGLADTAIQTRGISIAPQWESNDGTSSAPPRIVGYIARNGIHVRVDDLAILGQVIDSVVTDGANGLDGISFGLKDPKPALNEARTLSVQDARDQAELYSAAAGVRLVRITSIMPSGGVMPMAKGRVMSAMVADYAPVEAGEVTTRADVSVTWEIAPAE